MTTQNKNVGLPEKNNHAEITSLLLGISSQSHQDITQLHGVALQDLYNALKRKGIVNSIPVLEEHEPPETAIEEMQLNLKKMIQLSKAI